MRFVLGKWLILSSCRPVQSRETSEAGARSNASPTSRTEHRAESLNTAATSSRRNGVWSRRRTGYSRLHVLQEGLQHFHQVGHRVGRQMQPVHVPHAASEAGRSSTYRAGSCTDTRLAAGSRSTGRQPPLRESRPAGGVPQTRCCKARSSCRMRAARTSYMEDMTWSAAT